MNVFPHVLIRRCGGPFRNLQAMELDSTRLLLDKILQLELTLKQTIQDLTDRLYQAISYCDQANTQKLMLNVKRDIFNQRPLKAEMLETLKGPLNDSDFELLGAYESLLEEIGHLEGQIEETFERDTTASRMALKGMADDSLLQKGLLLSSQTLLKQTLNYIQSTSRNANKKEKKIENSLLKYLARMYAKTSPFSTFTNLSHGEVVPEINVPVLAKKADPEVVSHIRLNNFLFSYLKNLFVCLDEFLLELKVRLNPSVAEEMENLSFMTNHDNVEAFQRMELQPAVQFFMKQCDGKDHGIKVKVLVSTIHQSGQIEASEDEILSFFKQLMSYGLFELNFEVSGLDPDWDQRLVEQFAAWPSTPLVNKTIEVLKQLRKKAGEFGLADTQGREQVLKEAFVLFKEHCFLLHKKAGLPEFERLDREARNKYIKDQAELATAETSKTDGEDDGFKHLPKTTFFFKPENLFYEDTTVCHDMRLEEGFVCKMLQPINRLLTQMRPFEGRQLEQVKMRTFFDSFYKQDKVKLLQFYEDFYREFKLPEERAFQKSKTERKEGLDKKNAEKDLVKQLESNKWISLWRNSKAGKQMEQNQNWLKSAVDELDLKGDHVDIPEEVLERWEQSQIQRIQGSKEGGVSFGVFAQIVDSESGPPGKIILNSTFSGYGKMFSRFLHLFTSKFTEDVRVDNMCDSEDKIFMEDADASIFNANLHPPLMPYEVRIPGSQNSVSAENQIPVTELEIIKGDDENKLVLLHAPTGKEVVVFDLCFQAQNSRSKLFQLLDKFSKAESLSLHPLINEINRRVGEASNEDSVISLPRITLCNNVVLQRKKWKVPANDLPKKKEETLAQYFLKLNRWRQEHSFPVDVFVSMVDRREMDHLPDSLRQKIGRDDYKPQYISFLNPLLIQLLAKMMEKVPTAITITEMAPGPEHLLKLGNHRFVTEMVLQWKNEKEG